MKTAKEILLNNKNKIQGNLSAIYWDETIIAAMEEYKSQADMIFINYYEEKLSLLTKLLNEKELELIDAEFGNTPESLNMLLCDVHQLLSGWSQDGTSWSEHDESVIKRVEQMQLILSK